MLLRSLFVCAFVVVGYCDNARAALVDVTYTGTIYNVANNPPVSVDGIGLFGTAGANLGGQTISVIFRYDTSVSPIQVGPGGASNYIRGGSNVGGTPSPSTGVDVIINGVTFTMGGGFDALILGYNDGLSNGQSYRQNEAWSSSTQFVTAMLNGGPLALPKSIEDPFAFAGGTGTGFFRYINDQSIMTQALFTPAAVSLEIAAAVPEPSTWALMLLGFAGIGYLAWRRNARGVAAAIQAT